MHVLNVNSTLGLRAGGGTAERTFQMSRYLMAHRVKVTVTVLTLDIDLDDSRLISAKPVRVFALPCLWKRFYIPRGGWGTIKELVESADVIHLMGHWSILNVLVYLAARLSGTPYVVCPAGSLPLFGRSAMLKRIYNFCIGNALIKNAVGWIAVTPGEFSHFEAYGIPSSRVNVIPNGVSATDFTVHHKKFFLERFNLPDVPIILFMGRLNPIKGPDILLQAYLKVKTKIPTFHLVFAGPDEGMQDGLVREVLGAGISEYVHFIGFVEGADKSALYHNAKLLVVPSRHEAMSIVAIEAGICGTPVLLTDQCGFSEVRNVDERMEVAATVDGIASGLLAMLENDSVLKKISPVWKDFVLQRYSWGVIVNTYLNLYSRIALRKIDP